MGDTFNNVWDALFDDPAEKATARIKGELMDEIRNYIKSNNLKQGKAAELFGVSQPRVSDIFTGKISKFTIDSLVGILSKVDIQIDIHSSAKQEVFFLKKQEKWPVLKLLHGSKKKKSTRKVPWGTEISRPPVTAHYDKLTRDEDELLATA